MHGRQGGMHGRRVCMAGGVHGACMPPHTPPGRYYEIRSMIGRYASLLECILVKQNKS